MVYFTYSQVEYFHSVYRCIQLYQSPHHGMQRWLYFLSLQLIPPAPQCTRHLPLQKCIYTHHCMYQFTCVSDSLYKEHRAYHKKCLKLSCFTFPGHRVLRPPQIPMNCSSLSTYNIQFAPFKEGECVRDHLIFFDSVQHLFLLCI